MEVSRSHLSLGNLGAQDSQEGGYRGGGLRGPGSVTELPVALSLKQWRSGKSESRTPEA